MSARFALLVGVADYAAFDRSAGQPRGTSDLFGPPRNLADMWSFCQGLGFSAAEIALLAAPLAPPAGGHPALYAVATHDAVLAGVRLLAERLAAADAAQGLLYFSGHGDHVEGVGPVFCPADTEVCDGKLRNAVALAEVAAILEAHAPGKSVTIVLDSCGSGLPSVLGHRRLGRVVEVARFRDGDTFLAASAPHREGVEVRIDGAWRGAFTWALTTAADPYARRTVDGFVVPDLAQGAWMARAKALLRGISVNQRPELHGHGESVVLQPAGVPPIVPTGTLADQRRGGIEIWGDEGGQISGDEAMWTTFSLRNASTGSVIGKLVTSYATPSTALAPYSDFWAWNAGVSFPDAFRMEYENTGVYGTNSVPTGLPTATPMWAFPAGLAQSTFANFNTSGWQVWAVTETSIPNTVLAYLLKNTSTGAIRWLATWPGYSQRGELLSDLPSPQDNGGVLVSDASGTLWFNRLTSPPATLGSVVGGYDVKAASTS